MQIFLKYLFAVFLKNILRILYIFPVKKNKIIFLTFAGKQYSDSPKYIYEYLKENYLKQNAKNENEFEFIWVLQNEDDKPDFNVKTVKYRSFLFFYHMISAKFVINNQLTISYIPFRKKQNIIGTWHGGGAYKKCQLDVISSKYDIKYTKMIAKNVDYVISSCKAFSEAFKSSYLLSDDKYLEIGMPRNDILINRNKDFLYHDIKQKYNIDKSSKIVLYAPTFRSKIDMPTTSFINTNYNLDFDMLKKALKERFSSDFKILFRAHPKLNNINIPSDVIDVSNHPDMQELLYVSDVLINDYSSSMWDFSLTKKPIFIYAQDLKEYKSSRDFYTPIEKWPFPIAENNEELFNNILNFDEKSYDEKVLNHHKDLGSFENGNATKLICDKVMDIFKSEDIKNEN